MFINTVVHNNVKVISKIKFYNGKRLITCVRTQNSDLFLGRRQELVTRKETEGNWKHHFTWYMLYSVLYLVKIKINTNIHMVQWLSIAHQIMPKLLNIQSRIIVHDLLQSTFPINVVKLAPQYSLSHSLPSRYILAVESSIPQLLSVHNLEGKLLH